ncbi:hypothetical protein GJV06_04255 [Enterobacteriaceae bacterium RIT691]|nr:hypothetical protein [Enterobacteriaceae bacterium RIT691]
MPDFMISMLYSNKERKGLTSRIIHEHKYLEKYTSYSTFYQNQNAYDFYKEKPLYDIEHNAPPYFVFVRTTDNLYPQYDNEDCFEVTVLDTNRKQLVFCFLCFVEGLSICPVTWFTPEFKSVSPYLHNLLDLFFEDLMKTYVLRIDHRQGYSAHTYFWLKRARYLSEQGHQLFLCNRRSHARTLIHPNNINPHHMNRKKTNYYYLVVNKNYHLAVPPSACSLHPITG